MNCSRCSHEIAEGQTVCPFCNLALSQAVGDTATLTQQQVAVEEPRPRGVLSGGFIAIAVGVIALFVGGVVIGAICLACGIATIVFSRLGTRLYTLPKWQQALVWPGLIIGIVYINGLRLAAFLIRTFTQ